MSQFTILTLKPIQKVTIALPIIAIAIGSCFEFFDIAWGTGIWLGKFSLTWALIFASFCFLCLGLIMWITSVLWRDELYVRIASWILLLRNRMGLSRWSLIGLAFLFPVYVFQFTVWGVVFEGTFVRLLLWVFIVIFLSVMTTNGSALTSWSNFISVVVITTAIFSISASLKSVTNYPFSLGWSEGNRLWDYSIMFGRDRYDFPSDKDIFVLLEPGRQLIGGLPFLIPGISIREVRAWNALLTILPYMTLGLIAFRTDYKEKILWIILAFWSFVFLRQGPIHPPLVMCAILVALAWKQPLWLSIPLVILSGYLASISRYTWIFAPAMWIFVLEFTGDQADVKSPLNAWIRSLVLFGFGFFGGVILPAFITIIYTESLGKISILSIVNNFIFRPEYLEEQVTRQPLLWYRLFPNPTYGNGIIIGLLIAVGPLLFLLLHLIRDKYWMMSKIQKLSLSFVLITFLIVGLVASTKIGGGGDLHNMDMFLICIFFTSVIAWRKSRKYWLQAGYTESSWTGIVLAIALIIPGINPLKEMRSNNLYKYQSWLVALTDAPNESKLDMIPPRNVIDSSLSLIQYEVNRAHDVGEILFMDQRQLLTFGFIDNVSLVADYDKKVLIEEALASNRPYLEKFYLDLRARRFALIITQPLTTPDKGSDYQFGEENNIWVRKIAKPLLCYYKVKSTLLAVNVQLLIPNPEAVDC